MAALGTVLLHRHIPGAELAGSRLRLGGGVVLAAIVGILLAAVLAHTGALHQPSAAHGAAAGHLHHQRHGEAAIGITGASQELAESAVTLHQILAAYRTDLLADGRRNIHILAVAGVAQAALEIAVEITDYIFPGHIAFFHAVKLILHMRGKLQIGDVVKILLHPTGYRVTQRGNQQGLAFFFHIAAI